MIGEHKKCLDELEHLKGLLNDIHHWIDVIHERGQALFGAFNELKKHLSDLQRQMQDLHKQAHSYQVLLFSFFFISIQFLNLQENFHLQFELNLMIETFVFNFRHYLNNYR